MRRSARDGRTRSKRTHHRGCARARDRRRAPAPARAGGAPWARARTAPGGTRNPVRAGPAERRGACERKWLDGGRRPRAHQGASIGGGDETGGRPPRAHPGRRMGSTAPTAPRRRKGGGSTAPPQVEQGGRAGARTAPRRGEGLRGDRQAPATHATRGRGACAPTGLGAPARLAGAPPALRQGVGAQGGRHGVAAREERALSGSDRDRARAKPGRGATPVEEAQGSRTGTRRAPGRPPRGDDAGGRRARAQATAPRWTRGMGPPEIDHAIPRMQSRLGLEEQPSRTHGSPIRHFDAHLL